MVGNGIKIELPVTQPLVVLEAVQTAIHIFMIWEFSSPNRTNIVQSENRHAEIEATIKIKKPPKGIKRLQRLCIDIFWKPSS